MTKRPVKNVAASVHQRLLDVARQADRRFNDLVQNYAGERWLYRLSQSQHGERFVLKGALLLLVWDTPVTRPTRDIDLLGRVSNDLDSIRSVIAEVYETQVEDDGIVFDAGSVTTERIAEDADYEGVRARFQALLGNTRIAMQIDIGFSDVVTPGPVRISYPTILSQPAPDLHAYNRETAVSEKSEAMVKLGELNSRMKDFFDIWLLARNFAFDGRTLVKSIRRTFEQRETGVEPEPICFTDSFARDPSKGAQWNAFIRRSQLAEAPKELHTVIEPVRSFLMPPVASLTERREFDMRWPPNGPWQARSSPGSQPTIRKRMAISMEHEGGLVNHQSSVEVKIALFRSLFRGRDDVYPRRFESRKTGRSGYQPACANEWIQGLCEKPRVKCARCAHRRFLPITDEVIHWHLSGQDDDGRDFVMGVYPMFQDETCFFLATDFDKAQWRDDAGAFLETCRRMELPAALERSRSGNGGHIWLFFDEAVSAGLARKVGLNDLTANMTLAEDVKTEEGMIVVGKGQEVASSSHSSDV